ncbi:hypothetical protein ACH4U7_25950 [Streptomyces sp. NPDC020845]|uniref:hypothetical protein n=1 Tax=Streptomyces sp. NPDC020845 TaxID=3365096 RepID=UPI0037A463E5
MPPALTALVAEHLARDPQRRPESARQVLERLSRLRTALAYSPADSSAEARKVLPARTAGAMKAVLARAETLARARLGQRVTRPSRPPAETAVQTRRLPGSAGESLTDLAHFSRL